MSQLVKIKSKRGRMTAAHEEREDFPQMPLSILPLLFHWPELGHMCIPESITAWRAD